MSSDDQTILYPPPLVGACRHFFGLTEAQCTTDLDVPDPYWKITPADILSTVFNIFARDWRLYLPKLSIPSSFWQASVERNGQVKIPDVEESKAFLECKDPVLWGICGGMHHGKTTVAEYLVEEHDFVEYAFATPLKEGCRWLFGLTAHQVYGEEKDKLDPFWGVTPRYILQQVGTDVFRKQLKRYLPSIACSHTLWIENFVRWFHNHPGVNVCVSDVRFPDEAQCIRRLKGKVIKVVRKSLLNRSSSQHQHASEKSLATIPCHGVLRNDSTIEVLWGNVRKLLKKSV
jgi:hypothetical protein